MGADGIEYPSVTTELPGPRSAELFARTDRALSGALIDHDEVPFVESRKRGWIIEDADGDTIVNLKAGARIGLGKNADLYGGYGHSLTGDRWYRDVIRFELRFLF